jgi:hypothetical protein
VSYESIKIKPRTADAVTTLKQQCPCGNADAWQVCATVRQKGLCDSL